MGRMGARNAKRSVILNAVEGSIHETMYLKYKPPISLLRQGYDAQVGGQAGRWEGEKRKRRDGRKGQKS
jgi:hypothetical protein